MRDDAVCYASCSRSRMQHAWRKRPRDEVGGEALEWPADKQARLAGRPFLPAASPALLAGHATPVSLSKARVASASAARPRLTARGLQSRVVPGLSLLANFSPSPGFGGALAFSFRASVLRPPAAAPASLSKGAQASPLLGSAPAQRRVAGFSNYADGYYAMSAPPTLPPPLQPLAPPSSGAAASMHRAALPLSQQPPPPPLERGFASSKLLFDEGTTRRPVRWHPAPRLLALLNGVLRRTTRNLSSCTRSAAQMPPQTPPR